VKIAFQVFLGICACYFWDKRIRVDGLEGGAGTTQYDGSSVLDHVIRSDARKEGAYGSSSVSPITFQSLLPQLTPE